MSPHRNQAPGDPGAVKPKHDVFLCHSGAQKGFVWQLCKDLYSYDLHPFFDKDPESLPIGKDFPDLIFKAIEQCQVGAVFLSKEFFTLSHWPMFELVRMVECEREIMPIFLGLSPEDLSNEENVQRWKVQWQEWEKCNKRIDLLAWERAVKHLRRLNGLKYAHEAGVVAFRESIVKEILKKVGPSYEWDDSHVQGRSRLSEVLQEKIKAGTCHRGIQVMGIYGVGGIGKTTACKSMCKDLFMGFDGRVCHVELGDGTSERDRVQDVLTRLTNINKDFLKDKKIDECWSLLKKHLHLSKVFLAIDNVLGRKSIEEAKRYLKLGYCEGSIVMVTSRARGDLRDLKIDDGHCHEIPELEANEAKSLFLHHAEPEFEVEEQIVMCCIERCHFSKGIGRGSHYHPLALKVLGTELAGVDSREWKLQLEEVDVFNQRREQENGVFSILRRSFDVLVEEDKSLFMDVALFDIPHGYKERKLDFGTFCDSELRNMIRMTWNIFEWLSEVHGLSPDSVRKRLDSLKRKSLLEELGEGTAQIGMHDLWREFAVMETKIGEPRGGRWVYEVVKGEAENSSVSGGGWKDVRRICVMREMALDSSAVVSVKCLNFRNCKRVTVLKLVEVAVENLALDLSALKQLNSLEIVSPDGLYHKGVLTVSGFGLLTNLTVLIWLGIGEASVSAVEEVSCLSNLQVLQLNGVTSPVLDLRQLRWLREVRVESSSMESILGLSSIMTDLRIVDLGQCSNLRSCPGVGDVVGLEVLVLGSCRSLEELPDLQKLTKLRALAIWGCEALEIVPGVGSLVALQELHARSCQKLNELPDMSKLKKLEVLDLRGCELVKCIPGVGNLVALRDLKVGVQLVIDVPYLGNLTQLQEVEIWGADEGQEEGGQVEDDSDSEELHVLDLAGLVSVTTLSLVSLDHELSNLSRLTALTSLDLGACNMERLPHMGQHMRLEWLYISDCERLRGWDGVGYSAGSSASQTGVALHCDWTLPHLKTLEWEYSGWVELPDLSHFPRLQDLVLRNVQNPPSRHGSKFGVRCIADHLQLEELYCEYSPIVELPDLGRFPRLKRVCLSGCDNLTSLSISGPMAALESIILFKCSNLNALPSVDLFPRIHSFLMKGCGVELREQEVEKLRARGFCEGKYGSWEKNLEPSRDETTYHSEPDCGAGVQLALDGPDDVAAGPSSREEAPSCSMNKSPDLGLRARWNSWTGRHGRNVSSLPGPGVENFRKASANGSGDPDAAKDDLSSPSNLLLPSLNQVLVRVLDVMASLITICSVSNLKWNVFMQVHVRPLLTP